jgi:CDP-diacylglycerol---glycerol-3-phosphate 3-phosphatidyltransferase
MNLPNSLTLARIILIPVFLVVASMKFNYADYTAAGIFLIAALTDGLDGYFARKRNEETRLGKLLDPVADKILIMAALICLVEMGRLVGWIAIVIISREIAVTGLRAFAATEGVVISPNRLGKIKTFTQIVAVIILFLGDNPFGLVHLPFGAVAVTIALFFTVWSGLDYFIKFSKTLNRKNRE